VTTIRAIIFDMDGVLIDAKQWHYEALNKALGLFGYGISREEHLTKYDGLPTRKKMSLLTDECSFPAALSDFVEKLKQLYTLEMIGRSCKPTAAHQTALSSLRSEGYVLAVASNSIRKSVDQMMELSGLQQYLQFTLSNEDVLNPKPDPEIYEKAIAMTGHRPDQCVILEDNPYGIESALRAGANVLRVESTAEVTYQRIRAFIDSLESSSQKNRDSLRYSRAA